MPSLLPNTFCVFILSHGRADDVVTCRTLERCGYTGRLYIVVDNEDSMLDRYRRNFGSDRVVVFDKKTEADACDEGNNLDDRRVPLMARNICFEIAEQLGVTHFLQLDDDYTQFKFRFENKLGYECPIGNIDRVFKSFLDFYEQTPTTSIAFSQGGDHIGGFAITTFKRKAMNSFFCSTNRPFRFVGSINEDVNTYTTLGSKGLLFFTFTSVQLDQKETQSQKGGFTDVYLRFGTYYKSFMSVMMMPSAVSVAMMSTNYRRLHHLVNWECCTPCIIREQYRKDGGGLLENIERQKARKG